MHVTARLLQAGHNVTGVDNLNHYYDVRLKQARLDVLQPYFNFRFLKMDLAAFPWIYAYLNLRHFHFLASDKRLAMI
jgi:nucleoside-diphosphate-sugar epimerase